MSDLSPARVPHEIDALVAPPLRDTIQVQSSLSFASTGTVADPRLSTVTDGELIIRANVVEKNALVLQNLSSSGYGTLAFRTHLDGEVLSLGYCGPDASVYPGAILLEFTDASGQFGGQAPDAIIGQFSNYGSGTPLHIPRLIFRKEGQIQFFPAHGGSGSPYLVLDAASSTVHYGYAGEAQIQTEAGASEITLAGTIPRFTGAGTVWIRAVDGALDNTSSIQVRLADGRSIRHSCFGGPVATAGHQFWTGGLYGAQVERLRIGDDGISCFVPLAIPGLITPATALADGSMASGSVFVWLEESANLLHFKVKYAGGTVKNATLALT